MLLGNSHALVAQQNRDSFDGNSSKKQFNSERVAEAVRMSIRNVCEFEELAQSRLLSTKVAVWELAENSVACGKPL